MNCSSSKCKYNWRALENLWRNVILQRAEGTRSLIGLMVESHLKEGSQPIPKKLAELQYGVSITDSCIGWETTERMLRWANETLAQKLPAAKA